MDAYQPPKPAPEPALILSERSDILEPEAVAARKRVALALEPHTAVAEAVRVRPPRAVHRYADDPQQCYIQAMGSHADLLKALGHSKLPVAQRFLALLTDPRRRGSKIVRLAEAVGLKQEDLFDIFKDYYHAQSMMTMLQGLPGAAEDIVADARSTRLCCSRCDGQGMIVANVRAPVEEQQMQPCPQCEGRGFVRKVGDPDARKYLGVATGQLPRPGGGAVVQVNVSAGRLESVIDEVERAGAGGSQLIELQPERD